MNPKTLAQTIPILTVIFGCGLADDIRKTNPAPIRDPLTVRYPASITFLNQPSAFGGALLCTEEGKDFPTIDIRVLDANLEPCQNEHLRFTITFGLAARGESDFIETDERGIAHINLVAETVTQGSYSRSGTVTIKSSRFPQAEASAKLIYTKSVHLVNEADLSTPFFHAAYDSTELFNNQCNPQGLSSMFYGMWIAKIKALGLCGAPYPNLKLGHAFTSQASLYPSEACSDSTNAPTGPYLNDTFHTDNNGIAWLPLKRAVQYNARNCDDSVTTSYLQYEDYVSAQEIETNTLAFVTRNPICD